MKTALKTNRYAMIDARNRELNEIIAGKLRQNPGLMTEVRPTLNRWLRAMDESDRDRVGVH